MDRNDGKEIGSLRPVAVALRKESVDRNASNPTPIRENTKVALRKESVDRNNNANSRSKNLARRSLSARRAWIEILHMDNPEKVQYVALRKESVDRNTAFFRVAMAVSRSLSARRAWIEMSNGSKVR